MHVLREIQRSRQCILAMLRCMSSLISALCFCLSNSLLELGNQGRSVSALRQWLFVDNLALCWPRCVVPLRRSSPLLPQLQPQQQQQQTASRVMSSRFWRLCSMQPRTQQPSWQLLARLLMKQWQAQSRTQPRQWARRQLLQVSMGTCLLKDAY